MSEIDSQRIPAGIFGRVLNAVTRAGTGWLVDIAAVDADAKISMTRTTQVPAMTLEGHGFLCPMALLRETGSVPWKGCLTIQEPKAVLVRELDLKRRSFDGIGTTLSFAGASKSPSSKDSEPE